MTLYRPLLAPRTSRSAGGAWTSWLVVRLAALALGGAAVLLHRGNVFWDITYYAHWARGTLTGLRVPYRDFGWEYPPAALPAMLLPQLVSGELVNRWLYGGLWVLLMLAADAAVLRSLLCCVPQGARHPATTLWVWGPPLLGALSWARFDLLPTGAAVFSLLAAAERSRSGAGWWAGVGAAVKLWPALLAPVQRTRRAAVQASASVAAAVAMVATMTFAMTGSTGFGQVLSYQSRRGLQCESLAALPILWLRQLHEGRYQRRFRFGAWEVVGPHLHVIVSVVSAVYAVGLICLGFVHWRLMRRDAGADGVALTAVAVVLLTLVTDKVLSPQYLLWLLGVLAVACVLDPQTWRPFVPWVLTVCGLTAVAFPWFYGDVLNTGWVGLLALTARDLIVVGLAVCVARLVTARVRREVTPLPGHQPDVSALSGLARA